VWVLGGEVLSHQPALGHAMDVGAVPADGVQQADDVTDALIGGRGDVEPVGQADTALVEQHHGDVPGQAFERAAEQLVLPDDLDVGEQPGHEQHRRPVAEELVGDAGAVGVGVPRLGRAHAGSLARGEDGGFSATSTGGTDR
jgi:hypothetical protein